MSQICDRFFFTFLRGENVVALAGALVIGRSDSCLPVWRDRRVTSFGVVGPSVAHRFLF